MQMVVASESDLDRMRAVLAMVGMSLDSCSEQMWRDLRLAFVARDQLAGQSRDAAPDRKPSEMAHQVEAVAVHASCVLRLCKNPDLR